MALTVAQHTSSLRQTSGPPVRLNTNVFAHFIDILFVSLGKSMIALNESDVFNEIAFTEPTLKLAAWDG
jgi:hypothetical protein